MPRLPQLYSWLAALTTAFPGLSKPQAVGLAWFSFGMVLARSSSVTAVATHLADLLGQKLDAVKQRLCEWYREARAKAGTRRQDLDVRPCFSPLLGWVLAGWPGRRLAVALDATTLGQRFTTLSISVLYKGRAAPVAWKTLPALAKHPWKGEWLALLRPSRRELTPSGWTVIVLTDRGLYARWLFRAIQRQGWHPFMRVNTKGSFRPVWEKQTRELLSFAPGRGGRREGRGEAFKDAKKGLRCTLLARRDEGYADPWLVLTDLPPEDAEVCWYGLRAWIEQGFKRLKSGGWGWQNTHMTDPARAERLWLVMAVATWWCLLVGGEAEAQAAVDTLGPVACEGPARRPPRAKEEPGKPAPGEEEQPARVTSVFVLGRVVILNTLLVEGRLRLGRVIAGPWPTQPPAARTRASPASQTVMPSRTPPQ